MPASPDATGLILAGATRLSGLRFSAARRQRQTAGERTAVMRVKPLAPELPYDVSRPPRAFWSTYPQAVSLYRLTI